MTTTSFELGWLRGEVMKSVRNKLGFTRDEAKKIFYQFRDKQNDEKPDPREPNDGTKPDLSEVVHYMRETSSRLDSIEKDLGYLKTQVDRILEKI